MREAVTLDLDALREAIAMCLDHCERVLGRQVDLGADFYWLIEADSAFDLTQEPSVNTGELSDDLTEIARMRHEGLEAAEAWHGLGHLLGPLTRLAALTLP